MGSAHSHRPVNFSSLEHDNRSCFDVAIYHRRLLKFEPFRGYHGSSNETTDHDFIRMDVSVNGSASGDENLTSATHRPIDVSFNFNDADTFNIANDSHSTGDDRQHCLARIVGPDL